MRGSRAQIDMNRYRIYMRNLLLNTPNLQITQEIATQILTQDSKITGVKTHLDNEYSCDKLIITTGTFLNGSSVIQNITIKPDITIGAGSVVVKDILKGSLAYENPCRVVKS